MTTSKPEATFTIQQMAAISGLSEYNLRYYEKVGLIEPIPRDASSGHRRYSTKMIQRVETLTHLRASGLSIDDMRQCIQVYERGDVSAAEQKVLFAAHAERIAEEIRRLQIRQQYLNVKVAFCDARIQGDEQRAMQIAEKIREIAKQLQ